MLEQTGAALRRPARGIGSLAKHAQPRRHVVFGQLMTTPGTELVRGAYSAKAVAAIGGEPVVALRAEVKVALHVRGTGRATRNLRLPQQEVKHSPDAAWHHEADQHPEA